MRSRLAAMARNTLATVRLTLRLDLGGRRMLGHGKVRLLEGIAAEGSIAAAGRTMGMSYRRAWRLVETLNADFGAPLVTARPGGRRGGGAALTPLGTEVVARYRAIEARAAAAAADDLKTLAESLRIVSIECAQ